MKEAYHHHLLREASFRRAEGPPGRYAQCADSAGRDGGSAGGCNRKGFKMIIDGQLDDLPEQAFYMRGGIEEAQEATEKMAAVV
jgi:hypothetical protein